MVLPKNGYAAIAMNLARSSCGMSAYECAGQVLHRETAPAATSAANGCRDHAGSTLAFTHSLIRRMDVTSDVQSDENSISA
jgi:hypothetical protein